MAGATNPNSNSNASSNNTKSNPVDAKEFYGYLYDANKAPTRVLDALLRAIGQHIVSPPLTSSPVTSPVPPPGSGLPCYGGD